MKLLYVLTASILFSACTAVNIFAPSDPHARYEEKLRNAGLSDASIGKQWIDASEKSLRDSFTVTIPYREAGYFDAAKPRAASFRFKPKRGQKITISVDVKPKSEAQLFVELWRIKNDKTKLVKAADSSLTITYEQEDDHTLLLRLQPELLVSVSYVVTVVADPSLAFPVPGNDGKKVGSFWGDQREGGKRSHEGIDIFDKFRTPVIAAYDGVVTRVNENRLGGKSVWMRPEGKPYVLYYAHLDVQIASPGEQVKQGDTLGLMGNTGNAKYTPTHLHFGIYDNGAVDPLPFIQQTDKTPPAITGNIAWLHSIMRTNKKTTMHSSPYKKSAALDPVPANTPMQILAATGNYYLVQLPDRAEGFVLKDHIEPLASITTSNIKFATPIFTQPDTTGAVKHEAEEGATVEEHASFGAFRYIKYKDLFGWVRSEVLGK